MAQGPYEHIRQVGVTPIWQGTPQSGPPATEMIIEVMDTANVSAQKETLYIRTRVSPPYPNHPQAMVLAALIHVRDLLDAQIQAMQSP
jgi:hypothetical protein